MSRTTDTGRGAWMAFDMAVDAWTQPDMFDDVLPAAFWREIQLAAMDQLDEIAAMREALA
ncbi:hypothetical protein [Pseudoxanthomonas sp.]|uniref:hypothetical protein n=1 Tax=Pseudoxanthomonas sp. TaxID=1871049 RepID=UPI00258AD462|nr:hypothetical protein [Pseudoxanthomonas sp.]MCR6687092.1 hypothetical protein [Pseudoxanthomonas sp.]